MPRTKLHHDRYLDSDLEKAIRATFAGYGFRSVKEVAETMNVSPGTLGHKIPEPGRFTLKEFRALIQTIHLNPIHLLKYLGYSMKDIRQMVEGLPKDNPQAKIHKAGDLMKGDLMDHVQIL